MQEDAVIGDDAGSVVFHSEHHTTADGEVDQRLHRAAWDGDVPAVRRLVEEEGVPVDSVDAHGNGALHIAAHMHHLDVVQELLRLGATATLRSHALWNPLQEAIAACDQCIATELFLATRVHMKREYERRLPHLFASLADLPDFYLELKWECHSWMPFVTRFLPHDTYKIWKVGTSVRVDTTLVGREGVSFVRGNVSVLFHDGVLNLVDFDKKQFRRILPPANRFKADNPEHVRCVMKLPLKRAEVHVDRVTFERVRKGWIWSSDKVERIGDWECHVYKSKGISVTIQSREWPKSKHKREDVNTADGDGSEVTSVHVDTKSTDEYFAKERKSSRSTSGRVKRPSGLLYSGEILRRREKAFEGTVWISDEFPHTMEQLKPIFEMLAPTNKHFVKMEQLLSSVPNGFPVKMEMPIFPTVTATASFLHYEELRGDDEVSGREDRFLVPEDFVEDVEFHVMESSDSEEMELTPEEAQQAEELKAHLTAHQDEQDESIEEG